jgi:hypothetical protein
MSNNFTNNKFDKIKLIKINNKRHLVIRGTHKKLQRLKFS